MTVVHWLVGLEGNASVTISNGHELLNLVRRESKMVHAIVALNSFEKSYGPIVRKQVRTLIKPKVLDSRMSDLV